jgi:hypothetical protein
MLFRSSTNKKILENFKFILLTFKRSLEDAMNIKKIYTTVDEAKHGA